MRKLFLLLCLIAIASIGATGQIKYQKEIVLGVSLESAISKGEDSPGRAMFHHVSSARINDYFSFGLGVGVDIDTEYVFDRTEYLMPLYLNAKGYLPLSDSYLFLEFSGGHSFGISRGSKGMGSILLDSGAGMIIEAWPGAVMRISLNLQYLKWQEQVVSQKSDGVILLKVGVLF